MKKAHRRFSPAWVLLAVGMAALILAFLPRQAAAQTNKAPSRRWVTVSGRDGDITILPNGDVRVVETWRVQFHGSPAYTYAYREIPLNKVEDITDWGVAENGKQYVRSDGKRAGTFNLERNGVGRHKSIRITWHFPPTENATRVFTLSYTLKGALWIDQDFDRFFWKFIESDRSYTIESATVKLHLPARFRPQEVHLATFLNAKEQSGTARLQPDGQTIVFHSGPFPGGTEWEIQATWPHGFVKAAPPAWEKEEKAKPWIDLGGILLGLFIALGGAAGALLMWYLSGRDPEVGAVPEFLPSPPDDAPPGILGTVVDEKADLSDILATMLDLARRGYLRIEAKQRKSLFGKHQDVTFVCLKGHGEWGDLMSHEREFLKALFGPRAKAGKRRTLASLSNRFYTSIPTIQKALYDEVTKAGYFSRPPDKVRGAYTLRAFLLGILAAIPAVVAYFLALDSFVVVALSIGAAVVFIALLVVARIMPHKTKKGAVLAAKGRAFRNYLEHLERYSSVEQAKSLFEKYLPYATAFGISKEWTKKFAAVNAPMPTWYTLYTPDTARHGRGFGGKMASPTALSGGQMPSLNSMADGAFNSLSALSDSLTTMLNDAARTFVSSPSSSGGGGGGGGGGGSSGFG